MGYNARIDCRLSYCGTWRGIAHLKMLSDVLCLLHEKFFYYKGLTRVVQNLCTTHVCHSLHMCMFIRKHPHVRKNNENAEHLNFSNKNMTKFVFAITKTRTRIHQTGRQELSLLYSDIEVRIRGNVLVSTGFYGALRA